MATIVLMVAGWGVLGVLCALLFARVLRRTADTVETTATAAESAVSSSARPLVDT
jgi:hypothetical protein